MFAWLKRAKMAWDISQGRFHVEPLTDAKDRVDAAAVINAVRDNELHRSTQSCKPEELPLHETGGLWRDAVLLCRDTHENNRVIGIARATWLGLFPGGKKDDHDFSMIPDVLRARSYLAHGLSILPSHRKTGASAAVMLWMYQEALKIGTLLAVLEAEPGLYPTYLRVGYRPIDRVRPMFGVPFAVTMALVLHDIDHIRQLRSPLTSIYDRVSPPREETAIRWFREFQEQGGVQTGMSLLSPREDIDSIPLLSGMSDSGRKALLGGAAHIECDIGQEILTEGDGAKWMALVERGLLEVLVGDRVVALRSAGELIGEIAFVLDVPRTATVRVASPQTKLLLLSRTAVSRLASSADRELFWQNLSMILAQKLTSISSAPPAPSRKEAHSTSQNNG
ncbi:MAG: cyclic nucleotide-binding domain-containing protein [Myxococcales bacterium]|nr:cyclic nucleotide-binding domain-containing protein [Myxococcales bacterium]